MIKMFGDRIILDTHERKIEFGLIADTIIITNFQIRPYKSFGDRGPGFITVPRKRDPTSWFETCYNPRYVSYRFDLNGEKQGLSDRGILDKNEVIIKDCQASFIFLGANSNHGTYCEIKAIQHNT